MNDAGLGHNMPPTPIDLFGGRTKALQNELNFLSGEVNEYVAAILRDIVKKARDLEIDLESSKKSDKAPHLDAAAAIESTYRPLVTLAGEIKGKARTRLDAFLKAEEDRRIAEANAARLKAEEAAQAAALAAQDEDDPFAERSAEDAQRQARLATIAADHAEQKANAGASIRGTSGARAASLRSYWSVKVIDPKKLVAHFAKDTAVVEAATKAANAVARATRGTMPIPGCELKEERRSA